MNCKVDIRLIPMKIFYFCFVSGICALILYVSPFMEQMGLTYNEIGIIMAVTNTVFFLYLPIVGIIADKYQCFKMLIICSTLAAAVTFNLMQIVPRNLTNFVTTYEAKVNLTYKESYVVLCNSKPDFSSSMCWPTNLTNCVFSDTELLPYKLHRTSPFSATCAYYTSSSNMSLVQETENMKQKTVLACDQVEQSCKKDEFSVFKEKEIKKVTNQSEFVSPTFWLTLVLFTIGYVLFHSTLSLADTVTFHILSPNFAKYGYSRWYGPLGNVVAPITSFAIYRSSESGASNLSDGSSKYLPSFLIFLALMIVIACSATTIRIPGKIVTKFRFGKIGRTLLNPRICAFYVVCLCLGVCFSQWIIFFYMAVGGMLSPPDYFMGVMTAVEMLIEIPAMGVSGVIIQKLGEPLCLCISLFAWGLRFFLCSLVTSHWVLLPIQLVQGVAIGLMFPTIATYASRLAPEGIEATVQGLSQALLSGLGSAIGGLLGSVVLKQLGDRNFFRFWGGFAVGCSIFYFVVYHLMNYFYDTLDNELNNEKATVEAPLMLNDTPMTHSITNDFCHG